jgi:hypothetical protein
MPFLDVGANEIGLVAHEPSSDRVDFYAVDFDLTVQVGPVQLNASAGPGEAPRISHDTVGYAVAWYDPTLQTGAIWGTAIDDRGRSLVPPRTVTDGRVHARYPALASLGDRVVLAWSDDRDHNQGYEIYVKTLSPMLVPLSAETRLTVTPGDSLFPTLALGPEGGVGVLFRDDRAMAEEVWFTALRCGASGSSAK